ncbi:MAG: hypothetical protein MUE81_01985 [Thermoflexibacter sp.]|nr:hypothetical protein [Thermoflexibacter sp.]
MHNYLSDSTFLSVLLPLSKSFPAGERLAVNVYFGSLLLRGRAGVGAVIFAHLLK